MKKVLLSFITLALLAGVASADRDRGRGRWKHQRGDRGGASWSGGVRVHKQPARVYREPRRVYVQRPRVVRRPIYVQRPVIQYRYYNYYQRPRIVAESYAAMPGYYWGSGQWQWNGYEWIWQPGHYEPDPNYVEPGTYDTYPYEGY